MLTLKEIKDDQDRLAEKIAAYEAQNTRTLIEIPRLSLVLDPGEHYAGIITAANGGASHHLILIEGEAIDVGWLGAKEWAREAGGELPTRREQALLYANLKDQFGSAWYWSCWEHAGNECYAWCQNFGHGTPSSSLKVDALRARAVRRLTIQ